MGKGNRSRTQRAAEVVFASGSQNTKASEAHTKKVTALVVALVAILLAGCIFLSVAASTGIFVRSKTAAKSDNYKVSGTMLSYLFMSQYQYMYYNIYSQYGESLAQYLLPAQGTSLKLQKPQFAENADQTWYDYLMEMTTDSIRQYLTLCEEAAKAGIKLDDEDKKGIDESIDALAEYAAQNGYATTQSYIAASYGKGVSVSDIRKAMELSTLASKYQKTVTDSLKSGITDEKINKLVEENKGDYYVAKSLSYTFSAALSAAGAEATDEEKKAYSDEKAEKKALADNLAKITNADEFKKAVGDYLMTKVASAVDSAWEEEAADLKTKPADTEITEFKTKVTDYINKLLKLEDATAPEFTGDAKDAFGAAMDTVYSSLITNGINGIENRTNWSDPSASDASDTSKWMFDSARKAGDTTVISSEGDSSSSYTAYLMTETSSKDTSKTKDVAHILITSATAGYDDDDTDKKNPASSKAKAEAEKILADFNNGEKTLDAFKKLGEEKTEDSNVVYEGVYEGQMVKSFEDWTFDSARKPGDTGIVETEYGYHIMYFIGDGDELWKENASAAVLTEELADWFESKASEYHVTFNDKVLNSLDF